MELDNATNYSLSFGKLISKKIHEFQTTNINLMLEFVGQTINENGKSYLDVVPAIIYFNSQARLDLAYRQELISSMLRSAPNGLYFNLYYTFFNLKTKQLIFLKLAIMKTLFITALLAITVASCNQKVRSRSRNDSNCQRIICSMHPEVTGKRFRMSGMWYGTNRESGARYSNGKEDAITPM
jgi:hypothetical protein